VLFEVADTSRSMTPEQGAKLFEPFFQVHSQVHRSAQFGGTGLGLAITKRLSNGPGGDVTLTTEQGKGSVLALSIPDRDTL
jgi:signal transduction histidine kinase